MYLFADPEVYLSRFLILIYLFWDFYFYFYTWSALFKLMYLSSNSEVYLKYTFNIDVLILKLRNILEEEFQNSCLYVQTWNTSFQTQKHS